jgi:outer membrane receptor protein involved in Fe transport
MNSSVRNAVRTAIALSAASAFGISLSVGAQDQVPPPPPKAAEPKAGGAAAPLEEVIVEGRQQSAAQDVIEERLAQDVVADIVSSEQISRVGDSSVSLALRRLPAVTVVGDQYIYVRGLGERYSSTTLNGAYVPSPDLTRNVIPLDLFPSEIVETLSVQKGYSPDQPAAFGGGSVDIRTRGIPDELVLDFEVGTGWNTDSDDDGISYPGGDDDKWGTDDGTRALPAEVTTAINDFQGDLSPTGIFTALNRDGEFHAIEEAEQINRQIATSLNRDLDFTEKSLDPDLSVQGAVGNSWDINESGDWTIGAMALADYKNQWRNRERINRSVVDPELDTDQTLRTTNQVTLTGSLALGIDYADEHQVQATGIFLRNTDDEASLTLGNNGNFQQASGQRLRNYRIRYEERELEVLQFHGRHTLGSKTLELLDFVPGLSSLEGLDVDWFYSDATAKTAIPNEVLFSAVDSVVPDTGELISTSVRSSATAADFRFTDLEDTVTSYGVGVTLPIQLGNFLFEPGGGYDYTEKGRSYLQTQLGLGTTGAPASVLVGTPGQVFTDENVLDPNNDFVLSLGGIGTESYLAGETVDAAWGKLDVTWNETWRLAAGARWEDFSQLSVPIDQYEFDTDTGKIPVPADQLDTLATNDDDYYPAAAVTWMRDDFWAERFQLRFGWSETTARPDLREISDATFIDPLTEARVTGNPDLEPADLANFDIRGEWFFESGDNFTVSLFYKDIEQPIETIEATGTDDNISLTFINADSAEIYGVEFEGLKDLGFIAPESAWADAFFVSGNVTLSESEITIGNAALNLTNNVREMSQHSPWVVNLQLGFDAPNDRHSASLAYNAFGKRLFFAGVNGAPDAFEQPFHSLDLIYSYYPTEAMTIKLRLQNLLDEQLEIEQGGVTVLEQTVGSVIKLDLAYRF